VLILQVLGGSSLAAVCFPAVFIGEVIGLIHILFIWLYLVDLLSKDEASGIETTCAQGRFSSPLDIYQIGGTK
jgi:tetrahydromethanopterin S-methyltransferase subunit D